MESSRKKPTEEELSARPTLKFITFLSELMASHAETAQNITKDSIDEQADLVERKVSMFGKTILGMDERFLEYEATHDVSVDIRLKQTVLEKKKVADELEKKMRALPAEDEKITDILDEKISAIQVGMREIDRGRLIAEFEGISKYTENAIDARTLQKQRDDLRKKKNKICCPCTGSEAKKQAYRDRIAEIDKKIAATEELAKQDKEKIKESRALEAKRVSVLSSDISDLSRQQSSHIDAPIVKKIDEVDEMLFLAEQEYHKAKTNLEKAEEQATREIGRQQIANLLLLLAQFLEFKESVNALYFKRKEELDMAKGESRDTLETRMKVIATFLARLEKDQEKIERYFKKFNSSETLARTGAAIYRDYQAIDESVKREFTQNSFVDGIILKKIIKPAESRTPESLRVSDAMVTLFPARTEHKRNISGSTPTVKIERVDSRSPSPVRKQSSKE